MLSSRKSASLSSLARCISRDSSVSGVGGALPSAVARRRRRKTELVRLSADDETRMPTLVAVSYISISRDEWANTYGLATPAML